MKLGKMRRGLNRAEIAGDSDNTNRGQDGFVFDVFYKFLPIISTFIVILLGFLCQYPFLDNMKSGFLTLILTSSTVFYIRLQQGNLLSKMYAKTIITIAYLGSILLLFVPFQPGSNYWMIGGFLVALMLDSKLGLLVYFNISFLAGIIMYLRLEELVYLLIIGIIMSILTSYLKNKSTIIYASIILLSTNVTLTFLVNNFILDDVNYNYVTSLLSIVVVILVSFYLTRFYELYVYKYSVENTNDNTVGEVGNSQRTKINIQLSTEEIAATLSETSESLDTNFPYQNDIRTSLELLTDEKNALLQELKKNSENIYEHSLRIASLSYRAAQMLNADELLAKAGGLYHEIGKIRGNNYIEEGLSIADDYGFPKELKDIIRQHNLKYEKPASIEAAIVMLSDSVVSTLDYIDKIKDNRFTTNKIIENIFQLRMEKGTFDDSGLSIKDYKLLKEFYQKELMID